MAQLEALDRVDTPARMISLSQRGFENDGQRIPLALYLHVNDFNDFEYEVLSLILNVDHTLDDVGKAISLINDRIGVLVNTGYKPQTESGDMVNRPKHYDRLKIEPTFYNEENGIGWLLSNANKYVARHRFKFDAVEDLKKAMRNLAMYIRRMQGDPEWSR